MTGCWIISLDVSVGTLLLHKHTLRHWWLSPSVGGIAGPYETRLRQLCLSRASSLSTETPAVSPQRLSSSRVRSPSLLPRHWRHHNTTLAASARTGRLQSGCYGISRIAWSCPTIPQSASSTCRWLGPAVADSVLLRRISCTFHHSVCQLSVVVLFPSPRPHSGTHCRWMSSLPLHFRSSASVWRHSSSTKHFLMLYDRQTTLSWT